MSHLGLKQGLVLFLLGLLGWALCGTIMFVGMALIDLQTTLIIHLIGAPIIFTLISLFYFTKLNYTSPLQTGIIFLSIIIFLDFFLVALVINRSFDMFLSPIGTWIPFLFIFLSTYRTGMLVGKRQGEPESTE
ncbi:MAG: hypothetical protein H8E26_02570 [FCB group bacterium]|nr:hypothetical protein [FCB group bacterium]MBL7027269.1 hypothetical protein [Candidatus Neomarinimicrobiota bacterium]MBL7122239.1 hypothetical protein [Candidatus Neomarinimicrobiota bacterium]